MNTLIERKKPAGATLLTWLLAIFKLPLSKFSISQLNSVWGLAGVELDKSFRLNQGLHGSGSDNNQFNPGTYEHQYQRQHQHQHKPKPERRSKTGEVYLVGAGPGHVDLLTLKAHRLLQTANVILFDSLVSDDIKACFNPDAEHIYVGKRCGQHSMAQEKISNLICQKALQGHTVVRLKGGDPAIFARTQEETDMLSQANIPFCIVPGITAASAAAAFIGMPLTQRGVSQGVRFITAHTQSGTFPNRATCATHAAGASVADEQNWQALVDSATGDAAQTLVFYMGLNRLDCIADNLIKHGLSANTPVAVIDKASTSAQKSCIATLATIATAVQAQQFSGPAVTIVGEVVSHRQDISQALWLTQANAGTGTESLYV